MPPSLLILLPTDGPAAGAPSDRPLGRTALALEREGVPVLLGDRIEEGKIHGWRATESGWSEDTLDSVSAVHDRYPSEARRESWDGLREALGDPLFGNPPSLTLLCKDKLLCQRFLEEAGLKLPEVEGEPHRFEARLREWGAAFLKPRRGSRGDGVRRIRSIETLPPGDWVLQRAVPPPPGLAGLALRLLVQREPSGDWWIGPPVARRSTDDPVVNAARGAEVVLGSELVSAACSASVRAQSLQVAVAFAAQRGGERVVELGLDFVVDPAGLPHLIEVNSCPRGRLLHLARHDPMRWGPMHQSAVTRPLRRLLALALAQAPAPGPRAYAPFRSGTNSVAK